MTRLQRLLVAVLVGASAVLLALSLAFQRPSYGVRLSSTPPTPVLSRSSSSRTVPHTLVTDDDDVQIVHYDGELLPVGLVMQGYDEDESLSVDEDTSDITAEENFHSFVEQRHLGCQKTRRLGKTGDGGWNICLEGPYKPGVSCTVYSFGIGFDFSFDDSIYKHYNCQVKSFDPTMRGIPDHKRSKGVFFFKMGLSGANTVMFNGWHMKTLGTIMKELGDDKVVIDYLKMDIESSEWDALEAMFAENVLPRVKQLAFEIHTKDLTSKGAHHSERTVKDLARYWRILRHLQQLGFKKWYQHENPMGYFKSPVTGRRRSCCYELVYINMHFLNRTYAIPPLTVQLPYDVTIHPLLRDEVGPPLNSGQGDVVNVTDVPPDEMTVAPPIEFNYTLAKGFAFVGPSQPIEIDYDFTNVAAEEEFYRFVKRRTVSCHHHVRMGHVKDGGWDLCVAYPYELKPPCTVYSFGIGNDWSFDDAVSEEFGCEVRAFDPSLKRSDYKRSQLVRFYQTGLAGSSQVTSKGWKLEPFGKILHQLGHSESTIDVLKLDIEYWEWESLRAMLMDGSLRHVKQLVLEIHTREVQQPDSTSVSDLVTYGRTLQSLENIGFLRWHSSQNNLGRYVSQHTHQTRSCCWNLYYLNLKYMVPKER